MPSTVLPALRLLKITMFCRVRHGLRRRCDIASGAGNISAAPLFVPASADNYRLSMGSPGIDAGTNSAPDLPAIDYYGQPRTVAGTPGGPAVVDIGIAEFQPCTSNCPTPTSTATATATATPKPTPKLKPTPKPVRLTVAPAALAFGRIAVNATSNLKAMAVINWRKNPATMVSVTDAASPSEFQITNTCIEELQPGARCNVYVDFKPTVGRQGAGYADDRRRAQRAEYRSQGERCGVHAEVMGSHLARPMMSI